MSSLSDNNLTLLWNRMKIYINNRLENLGLDHLHTLGQVATKDVVPIENGGTNANTVSNARNNINFIGLNPISNVEDDTSENWRLLGTGIAGYNIINLITDQPTKYGILENQVFGYTIFQKWNETESNGSWYRRGNQNGWQSSWIKMLDEGNGITMTKLWENASSTSEFPAQTINLDLSNYSHILIIYSAKYWNGNSESKGRKSVVVQVGDTAVLNNGSMAGSSTYYTNNTARAAEVKTNGIVFGISYVSSMNSAPGTDINNDVPMQIFGIKGVL